MSELPRSHLAIYATAFAVIALLGARQLARDGGEAAAGAPAAPIRLGPGSGDDARAVVHVAGAVRRPGVYRLRAGSRVDAAVRRAGGPTRAADLTGLNLAAKVEDGRQVVVPERLRIPAGAAAAAAAAAAAGGAGAAGADPGPATVPVNLNTATLEQLDTLDGVGPATAQKILDFRAQRGGFGSVEELGEIPGIGDKRMAAMREKVTV